MINIADSVLIVSNTGDGDAQITFDVLSYDGVILRTADLVLGSNSTATRRLNLPAPSYVVVKVPAGSSVVEAWCSPSQTETSRGWPRFRLAHQTWPAGRQRPGLTIQWAAKDSPE